MGKRNCKKNYQTQAKGVGLDDQRRHRIDIHCHIPCHCVWNTNTADMEVEMNTRHRRKRLYPADEQRKRDEYFRDMGQLKRDERRLRQKRNFELWCEGRDKEMT